jgi:hypothetical protein
MMTEGDLTTNNKGFLKSLRLKGMRTIEEI